MTTAAFDMTSVANVERIALPMEKLVLEQKNKDLLLALAERVRGRSLTPWSPDFVKGKGDGMVILLHGLLPPNNFLSCTQVSRFLLGAPGTGKTMTVGM